MVALVDDIIIGLFGGWVVATVCDELLESIRELEESLQGKVDRLLNSPYISGKKALRLASDYARQDDFDKADLQIRKAIQYFDEAGSQLIGIPQIHSYCLAGMCCHLLYDFVGKKHYLQLAVSSLNHLKQSQIEPADRAQAAAVSAAKMVPRIFFNWQSYIPFYSYYHLVKSSGKDYKSSLDERRKAKLNENLPIFKCTIPQLANALEKSIDADYSSLKKPTTASFPQAGSRYSGLVVAIVTILLISIILIIFLEQTQIL